jgi:hypothetical protein
MADNGTIGSLWLRGGDANGGSPGSSDAAGGEDLSSVGSVPPDPDGAEPGTQPAGGGATLDFASLGIPALVAPEDGVAPVLPGDAAAPVLPGDAAAVLPARDAPVLLLSAGEAAEVLPSEAVSGESPAACPVCPESSLAGYVGAAIMGALALAVILGGIFLGWSLGRVDVEPVILPGGTPGPPVAASQPPAENAALPGSPSSFSRTPRRRFVRVAGPGSSAPARERHWRVDGPFGQPAPTSFRLALAGSGLASGDSWSGTPDSWSGTLDLGLLTPDSWLLTPDFSLRRVPG